MDIPNLSPTAQNVSQTEKKSSISNLPKSLIFIVIILALTSGFWFSRFISPFSGTSSTTQPASEKNTALSTDQISDTEQLQPGVVYGNTSAIFSDSAQGVVQAGSINGEGTHILVREGGDSQRVSLTSSTVDLDLFIDKKVNVKGQTNSSRKTGWLLDVGSIKIIE